MDELKVDATIDFLRICAHCNDCLNQIVASPDKLNVVVFYKGEDGTYKQWSPLNQ